MTDLPSHPSAEPQPRLLYCRCAYAQVVPNEVKDEVLAGLTESCEAFEAVPDLCEMAARRDPQLQQLASGGGTLRIAACWPRAVRGLFTQAGASLPQEGVTIHNMRTDSAIDVLAGMQAAGNPPSGSAHTHASEEPPPTSPRGETP